ncbi:MAG: hypothetical protein CMJ23_12665 [Phycisphaerae bacterium]|nr:hypothetical protein [Phycisphaerae bacterium]
MAPETLENRRSCPAISLKAPTGPAVLLIVTLVAQWIIFGIWALAPAVSEWHRYVQPLVWIPDWTWFVGLSPIAVVAIVLGIRSGRTGCRLGWVGVLAAVLPLAVVGAGIHQREWRPWASADSAPAGRIVFLNAWDPPREKVGALIDEIEALDADLVVIVNPGWIAPVWRERVASGRANLRDLATTSASRTWKVRWMTPFLVASRGDFVTLRTVSRKAGIKAVRVSLPEQLSASLGMNQVLVVDLPSDLRRSRTEMVDEIRRAVQSDMDRRGEGVDLVLGDLNLTPRTPALARLLPGMRDLFLGGGVGWGATWPRETPVVRIDFALGADTFGPTTVQTFDPGTGGHRGLILEVNLSAKAETSR